MPKEFPSILYQNKNADLEIEVMTFEEVYIKLVNSNNHNPFAPHKITFYIILVVTEGQIKHFVDFELYSIEAGDALFIAKNQVHHFTESIEKAKGFCIILNSAFLEDSYFLPENIKFNRLYNYHIKEPILHKNEMGDDSFIGMVQKLNEEYRFPNNFAKHEILRAYVHIILLKAERAKQTKTNFEAKPFWLEVFTKFRNKLETEYTKARSSKYYAAELSISYKFLNDVVKRFTGKTTKAFIDDFVSTEIKRYLVSSSLSVKEIAYITGFDEPTNMVKFFKKNTKTTPIKFRDSSL